MQPSPVTSSGAEREDHMPIIYNSRFTAEQNKRGNQRVVKCQGGYIIMSAREYQLLRAKQ
jgi:hypothetical protein